MAKASGARALARVLGEVAENNAPTREKMAQALLKRWGGVDKFVDEMVKLAQNEEVGLQTRLKLMGTMGDLILKGLPDQKPQDGNLRTLSTAELESTIGRVLGELAKRGESVHVDAPWIESEAADVPGAAGLPEG